MKFTREEQLESVRYLYVTASYQHKQALERLAQAERDVKAAKKNMLAYDEIIEGLDGD